MLSDICGLLNLVEGSHYEIRCKLNFLRDGDWINWKYFRDSNNIGGCAVYIVSNKHWSDRDFRMFREIWRKGSRQEENKKPGFHTHSDWMDKVDLRPGTMPPILWWNKSAASLPRNSQHIASIGGISSLTSLEHGQMKCILPIWGCFYLVADRITAPTWKTRKSHLHYIKSQLWHIANADGKGNWVNINAGVQTHRFLRKLLKNATDLLGCRFPIMCFAEMEMKSN